jgi:ParB-like chromosome segregation protein Spo0J
MRTIKRGESGRDLVVEVPDPVRVRIADLNEAVYNPRHISPEEMASLEASILKFGMVEPLVVQKSGMVLIGGHQRLTALRNIAARGRRVVPDAVPATVLDVDDATAMQLNVALNRIGGEFDADKLGRVLASVIDSRGFEPIAIGFQQDEVNELVRRATITPEELAAQLEREASQIDVFAKSVTMTVAFETVEQRDEAKRALESLCGKLGAKPGAVVLKLTSQALSMSKSRSRAAK